jgi:hypothetical protein
MKTRLQPSGGPAASKRSKDGSITLIFTILLVIMVILVTAEMRSLYHLGREVKFLEKQQVKRLAATAGVAPTNSVPGTK